MFHQRFKILWGRNDTPDFFAPLLSSLVLSKGVGAPTFTRATAATVWGYGPSAVAGDAQTLLTVAAGETRFEGARRISEGVWSAQFADGSPIPDATLRGALVEGARTNVLLYSEAIDAWSKSGGVLVGADSLTAPNGSGTADKIYEDSALAQRFVYRNTSVVSGTTYTLSAYVKAGGRNYVMLRLLTSFPDTSIGVNLVTGAIISGNGTPISTFAVSVGNGWWRVGFSQTADATGNARSDFYVTTDGIYANRTYQGDGTSGFYLWGAQLEAGSFASSYIPTVSVAVTRNATELSYITTGNISDIAGTLYFECSATSWANTSGRIVGDAAEGALASAANSGVQAYDGTNTVNGPTGTPTGTIKAAISWIGVRMIVCVNGVLGTAGTYDGAWNLSAIMIGNGFYGTVRNVKIWKKAFTDAKLVEITR